MQHLRSRLRPLALALVAPTALLLAACGAPGASQGPATPDTPASSGATSSPGTSFAPGTPAPTAMQQMSVTFLPDVDFDPAALQTSCEEATDPGAVPCEEVTAFGVRIMRLMSSGPVDWIAIERPDCAATTCTEQELKSVTIVAQAPGDEGEPVVFSFSLDTLNGLFTFPVESPDATFPPAS